MPPAPTVMMSLTSNPASDAYGATVAPQNVNSILVLPRMFGLT